MAEQSQKAKVLEFAFDCAMDSTDPNSANYVSQDKCYNLMARRMVDHVLGGYFSCLFCYGQTGTGKTTTIMGKAWLQPMDCDAWRLPNVVIAHPRKICLDMIEICLTVCVCNPVATSCILARCSGGTCLRARPALAPHERFVY